MGNFIWSVTKKTLMNMLSIHQGSYKRKHFFLLITALMSVPLFYYRPPVYICIVFSTIYFWGRAIGQQIIEDYYNKFRYKNLVKALGPGVMITQVNRKDKEIHIKSEKPVDTIINQKNIVRHNLEKEVEIIYHPEEIRKAIIKMGGSKTPAGKLKDKYYLKDYIKTADIRGKTIPFLIGVDQNEKPVVLDLDEIGAMLLAAVQKGGKSVFLNTMIQTLMYYNPFLFFVLADFKDSELCFYEDFNNVTYCNRVEHLMGLLQKLVDEMESRYQLIRKKYTSVAEYNIDNPKNMLPSFVFISDEFSDIYYSDADPEIIERINGLLYRLLSKGRAAEIYVTVATHRPDSELLNTKVKSLLKAVASGRVINPVTQNIVGVKGTERLKPGEFILKDDNGENKYKIFFTGFKKDNEVYLELKKEKENILC